MDADPQLWLDRDVVNLPAARVREVAVKRPGEAELVLARGEDAVEGVKLALTAPPGHQATDESALDEVARALGVEPAQAAVFEDALAGVEAGRAGAFGWVIGVDRVGQADQLRAHGADVVVDDLDTGEAAVLELGATKHDHQPGTTFRVFLDPAGHPFCLCLS